MFKNCHMCTCPIPWVSWPIKTQRFSTSSHGHAILLSNLWIKALVWIDSEGIFMNSLPIIMVHDFLQCNFCGTYHNIIEILEMEMRGNWNDRVTLENANVILFAN